MASSHVALCEFEQVRRYTVAAFRSPATECRFTINQTRQREAKLAAQHRITLAKVAPELLIILDGFGRIDLEQMDRRNGEHRGKIPHRATRQTRANRLQLFIIKAINRQMRRMNLVSDVALEHRGVN